MVSCPRMTFQNLEIATVLVFVLAAFLLAQTIVIVVILSRVNQEMKRLEKTAAEYGRELGELFIALDSGLSRFDWLARMLPNLESSIDSLLDSLLSTTSKASSGTSKGIVSALEGIDEMERRFEFVLSRFSRQTSRVRNAVRYPSITAAALIHGLATALKTLRTPKKRPMRHVHDGESFI